jgi:hypothetical protein
MNPAMVESRKPLSFDDMPAGYVWVPGWGLMPGEEVARLGCIAGAGGLRGEGYLSPKSEVALRDNELKHAKSVTQALGPDLTLCRVEGRKKEEAKFVLRYPQSNVPLFPEPFGGRLLLLTRENQFPDILDLSKLGAYWSGGHGGKLGDLLLARLKSVPTRIHRKSSGLVSTVLNEVRGRFLTEYNFSNF